LFCEMKEIVTRPKIHRVWKKIERYSVPKFKYGYTVNRLIADEFEKMYGSKFTVIRNMPLMKDLTIPQKKEQYILYQGAVNEGRSFETLIPAFLNVNKPLLVAGEGNFMVQAQELVRSLGLQSKITFLGKLSPSALYNYTIGAWIGITLF